MTLTNIFPYLVAILLAFGLLLGLAPIAQKIELVDYPNSRKLHNTTTPLIGGIAISLSLFLSLLLFDLPFGSFRILFFCLGLIMIVGVLDDRNDLPAYTKFVVQFLIASVMILGNNMVVTNIGDIWANDDPQGLGPLSIPFTLIGVVGVINAFNLIDGHDGVAASLGIISILSLLIIAHTSIEVVPPEYIVFLTLLPLLLCVFLVFNLELLNTLPKVFLGDAGSMLLGLVLVYFLIEFTRGLNSGHAIFSPAVAPWIIGLPLLDMFCVVLRRLLSGETPLAADRQHIHHLLFNSGLHKISILLILIIFQVILSAVGISSVLFDWPDWPLIWGALVVFILYYILTSKLQKNYTHIGD